MSKMRTGILSDASIRHERAAFFAHNFETHEQTLSGFATRIAPKHNLHGLKHYPRRVAKPRTPVQMMMMAGENERDPVSNETVNAMVSAFAMGPQPTKSRKGKMGPPPKGPPPIGPPPRRSARINPVSPPMPAMSGNVHKLSHDFYKHYNTYVPGNLTPQAAAFIELTGMDPELVTGRFSNKSGIDHFKNRNLDQILKEALRITHDPDARTMLQDSYADIITN